VSTKNITIPVTIDISRCNKEPIHIPGSIQPHGVLFALKEPDLTILQVSDNIFNLFGLHPEELLNKNLNYFLETDQISLLTESLVQEDLPIVNPIELTIN
jgi:two-component system, chemotaxis family, sensor kinase Cph1